MFLGIKCYIDQGEWYINKLRWLRELNALQIDKAPANQENIFISLTEGAANASNTNK